MIWFPYHKTSQQTETLTVFVNNKIFSHTIQQEELDVCKQFRQCTIQLKCEGDKAQYVYLVLETCLQNRLPPSFLLRTDD